MEAWDKVKEVLFDISEWVVGAIILYAYGNEIVFILGNMYERFKHYYSLLFVFSMLDVIFVLVGLLFPWPTCIGIGFVAAIIIFVLSWTPVALAFVGVDKATKGKLGHYKLYPPVFGMFIFWICSAGLVFTLYPEIISMFVLVVSLLIAVLLLSLWHALGIKTHFQEWAMLVVVLLMVIIFSVGKIFPRFYDTLSRNLISHGQSFHDKLQTGTPTDLAESLYDVQHENAMLLQKILIAELDAMKKQVTDGKPLTAAQMMRWKEIEEEEFPKVQQQIAKAKLSPTSGTSDTTTTSGSGGGGPSSLVVKTTTDTGTSPRTIAVSVAILLAVLLLIGLFTRKIDYSQLFFGVAVVGIGLVVAWNYYAPPPIKLTLQEEKGCEQLIVRGPKFQIGDFIIPRTVSGGTAYWADGHTVKAGTGRPALDAPPLRFCATNPGMVITYEVMRP